MNPNYFKQSFLQRYMQLALVIGLLILLSLPSNAQLVPFAVRSKFNTFGDNRLIGNSNITCPDTIPSTASDNYRNGTLNQDNGSFTKLMYVNIDADGTNFNSSSARLSLNPAAKVLFAGLYWFGYSNNATRTSVRFKVPTGAYQNIASIQTGTFSNNTLNNYACFADVTSIVKALASPNGDYFVGNIQASLVEGGAATNATSPNVAGWSLIVTYYDPIETFRNLVVYDGFQRVTSGVPASITLTKFLTPATGTFSQHLGMLVCEGDFSIAGDTVALNGTTLSDSRHLVGNFFRSAITEFNADVPSPLRNPAYINNTGPDIVDLQLAAGIVPNGTTSATFNFQSTGDVYYPLALTFGVEGVPQISGTVFEDVNYGGGSGRSLAASSGVPIPNAIVELYDSAGAFVDFQITDPTGKYYFSGLAAGSYTVRVVNSSLSSTRSGGGNGEVAVQTFRTSSIVNQVGVPDTIGWAAKRLNSQTQAATLSPSPT